MRFVRIGTWLLAAILAVVLSSWVSRPAAAETDLSGNWNANYSLTCTAAITQSGNDLTADTDCGGGVDGTLTGTFDPASSSFSLTGGLGLIPVDVEGAVSPDGGSINGSFSYFPLVADGVFSGTREGTGDDTDLTGNWNITIIDVFSGNCQLAIRQVDSAISALLDCGGSLTGTFEGTIDLATGSMSLAGPFFGSIPLDLDGVVAKDGQSIAGTWALGGVVAMSGTFDASRAEEPMETPTSMATAPTSTETLTSMAAAPTSTAMPASLPSAGTVAGGGEGTPGWLVAASASAIAGAGALGGAAWYARRRWVG